MELEFKQCYNPFKEQFFLFCNSIRQENIYIKTTSYAGEMEGEQNE